MKEPPPNLEWKILLIDDEASILKVLSLSLQDAGYTVFTAADGPGGLAAFDEHKPQIVITDLRMPGMDGLEVLRQIKERDPNTEVIVLTAYGEMQPAVRALQLEASDFITKPLEDEALFVALERAKRHYTTRKELQDYTALMEEKWLDTAEELARTFNFQNHLIESSIDGILGCDEDHRIMIFNRSLERLLGYAKSEVRGQKAFETLFPRGASERFFEDLKSDQYGGPNRLLLYETHLLDKAGKLLPVQVSASVIFEDQRELGLVAFFRDLRELRRLEQEFAHQARLLQQDKMISLGRLAASVVHEINNPLTGILNYARLMLKMLRRGTPDDSQLEKFKRYLNLVENELSRCSGIVSNLLAFSRQSKLQFLPMDVNELLERSLLLSKHKLELQQIETKTLLAPNLPMISGDFNQMQQCIINLIFNALDAMPQGGSLTLKSALNPTRDLVEISISDTGCGISPEDLPRIFDPFFTTKVDGLGLGLSTVYGIVDRHKGTISVESTPGKGSTFTIKLPTRGSD